MIQSCYVELLFIWTRIYLRGAKNLHADELAALFGIK